MATIVEAETALVTAMLEYTDWISPAGVTDANRPYSLTVGTKREGDPRRFLPTATFPAVAMKVMQRQAGELEGTQQSVVFTMRMDVIRKIATGEEPTTLLRLTTGQMIENLLQTQSILASKDWFDLDWVSKVLFPNTSYDNALERELRTITVDQDGSGTNFDGYTASETDFLVTAYTQ